MASVYKISRMSLIGPLASNLPEIFPIFKLDLKALADKYSGQEHKKCTFSATVLDLDHFTKKKLQVKIAIKDQLKGILAFLKIDLIFYNRF